MMISPFPLKDVLSQIKEYIFCALMENHNVRLHCLSKPQNNALNQKHPQHNQQALQLMKCQDKMQQMNPVCLQLTGNGVLLSESVYFLWSYCWLSVWASREQGVKLKSQNLNSLTQIHRITKSDCKLNDIKIEYQKLNVKPRVVKIMSVNHTFKNQHRKHIHLHINLSNCRSSPCIIFCTAAVNIRHVNSMMCLTLNILQFPILKELLDNISVLCNKMNRGEVCFHPLFEILCSNIDTLHIHSMNASIVVYKCQNMYLINIIFKILNIVFSFLVCFTCYD